jgi:uncharacterized protein YheU (UPF0270 family)
MIVPYTQLQSATLRAVVLEFVSRDGTDHSSVETRIQKILEQLGADLVELDFDEASQSCNIVLKPRR